MNKKIIKANRDWLSFLICVRSLLRPFLCRDRWLSQNHLFFISGFFIFFITLQLICSILGFAEQKNDSDKIGDAFVSATIADARTLVPILASDSASSSVCSLIFNGLIKYDKDLHLVGDLAQRWVVRNGGLEIIFYLRKGVYWHTGKEFTADDVKFTYEKLIDPKVRTPYSGDFKKIKAIEIFDPYTIKVIYSEPFSPGLASWGMWIMPKHVLEEKDLNTTNFAIGPTGTGPYMFKKWVKGEKIELKRNKKYFDTAPFISRYIWRVIPDQTTIFLELQTKGVDTSSLTPLQFKRQTDTLFFKKHYKKFKTQGFTYTYLGFNLSDWKFRDKLVRHAIDYAINKNEIIEIVLLGAGQVATGPFLPQSWAHNPDVKARPFDPEKAKMLLNEAGWFDTDSDGIVEKYGKKFEFTLLTNQGNSVRINSAELIQKYLKAIGIDVKIKVIEWSALLSEFIEKRHFEGILLGWSLALDPDCYDIWHSSKTKPGEFNFVNYANPEVDRCLVQARRLFDENQRREYYHQIHELIHDDLPYIFLFVPDSLEIVSSRFEGIEPAPIGIGHNFIRWWVPKEEQRYRTFSEYEL